VHFYDVQVQFLLGKVVNNLGLYPFLCILSFKNFFRDNEGAICVIFGQHGSKYIFFFFQNLVNMLSSNRMRDEEKTSFVYLVHMTVFVVFLLIFML
jgi:hypothetical protein